MMFEQLLVVEEGDGSVLNIPGVLFFRVPSLPKDIKSKFVTLIFSSPIPGDKDDFAGVQQLLREKLEWQVGLEQMIDIDVDIVI